MSDAINPNHYRAANGMESIDFIEAFVPDKPHRWAALKYLIRAGKKPGQDEVQDLRKAIWWLEREIASIEKAAAPVVGRGSNADGYIDEKGKYRSYFADREVGARPWTSP